MKIGDMVKIRECDSLPKLVGENAEMLHMQIWVKMTSGERAGKVHVFRDGEVEEIPKDVTMAEDIVGVERVINEVKGKIMAEPTLGFWEGKTPCWEMTHCPEGIKMECPAFKYRSLPCWEIEGTYCKLDFYGVLDLDTNICKLCRAYKRYGQGKPIQIKLFGKGIDNPLKSIVTA